MTERQKNILELIRTQCDINTIKEELNLTDKDVIRVINSLNNKGYMIEEKFDFSGKHQLKLATEALDFNTIIEIKKEEEKNISFIAISDTHLLSSKATKTSLDLVYNYAVKNNINYILHTGDLIHDNEMTERQFEKKMNEVIKEYPKDKNITTFFIQGNHDYTSIERYGLNIGKMIASSRLDLIPIGIEKGIIKFNNTIIKLQHSKNPLENSRVDNCHMILRGHAHVYKLIPYVNKKNTLGVMVQLPSLSDMKMKKNVLEKGFAKINLNYNDANSMDSSNIEQYMIKNKKIEKLGEYTHQFIKVK